MRIGTLVRGMTIDEIITNVQGDRDAGYASAWLTDGSGMEPLTTLAVVGRAVPDIQLGTAVVRTLPRHPMVLAQQALTVNAMIQGRLTLGIGPSHRPAVEQGWGLPFDRPILRMRDYLSVLAPLIDRGAVDYDGQTASAHGEFNVTGSSPCPILVGALGPQMLRLAGRLADGTVTFMTGPRTLTRFTCPAILEAAERAGRPRPRIVALVALCVTDRADGARLRAEKVAGRMAALPSYAAMLRREEGPALIAGEEAEVEDVLGALDAAGVTDLVPIPVAKRESADALRTAAFVQGLLRRLGRENELGSRKTDD
jgi:5,10-methylenetetrahydromethanopterin reductase